MQSLRGRLLAGAVAAALLVTMIFAVGAAEAGSNRDGLLAFVRLSLCANAYNCEDSVYVVQTDGTGLRRLTAPCECDSHPAWSPDGSKIAYDGLEGIELMNPDGSGRRLVCRSDVGLGPVCDADVSELLSK